MTAMKKYFKFFSIAGGANIELVDVTRTTVVSDYQPATEENKNEYDSTVTKILWNYDVNIWLKNPIEGKDGIDFESTHFQE